MGGESLIFDIAGSGVHASAPLQVQLHGMVEQDGTAAVHGVVLLGEGRERRVLVATGTGGTTACADADRDGLGGIVVLTVPFREARTGAIAPVRITEDLDARGQYSIAVAIGDRVMAAEERFSSRWVGAALDQR